MRDGLKVVHTKPLVKPIFGRCWVVGGMREEVLEW